MSPDKALDKDDVCVYICIHMCMYACTYTRNGILFSHKKNEIMPFAASWMYLGIIILSKVSQTEKEKYRMMSLICGI